MNPQKQHASLELLRKPTIVATLVASAAATAWGHNNYDPTVDGVPYWYDTSTVVDDQARTAESAGKPHVETIETPTPGDPTTRTAVELHYPDGAYAENFADDPDAEVVDTPAVEEISNIVDRMRAEGWNVHLEVFGQASAEDESNAPDGGTTTPSDLNIELADARRDALLENIDETGALPADVQVIALPGREGNLNAEQYVTLLGFTEQFGYDSVKDMVDAWNQEQGVPPSVDAVLEAWLGQDRSVSVTIIGERQVPGDQDEEVIEEMVCVLPVKIVETTTQHEETEPRTTTIPLPILIPIPIVRRRRPKYDEETIKRAEKYASVETANRMRETNARSIMSPRARRQADLKAFRAQEKARVERDLKKAGSQSVPTAGQRVPSAVSTTEKNRRRGGAPLPWRKAAAGVVIALGLGAGAFGLSQIGGGGSGGEDAPKQGTAVEDPFCPPELREVIENTGEVEHRTIDTTTNR